MDKDLIYLPTEKNNTILYYYKVHDMSNGTLPSI